MHHRQVKIRPVGWLALALLVSGGIVHASAPGDQYEFFTPTDETITDRKTKLVWQRRVEGGLVTFEQAGLDCAEFYALPGQVDQGQWRLPTVKELMTLVDEQMYGTFEGGQIVYRPIDRNAFPNTPRDLFWSSTRDFQNQDDIWMVNFSDGRTEKRPANLQSSKFHYRCVRND